MKLSMQDIEGLTPGKTEIGMPTLAELDYAITLLHKRYPVDAWNLRRKLRWLTKMMDKHYDIKWTAPKWGTDKI